MSVLATQLCVCGLLLLCFLFFKRQNANLLFIFVVLLRRFFISFRASLLCQLFWAWALSRAIWNSSSVKILAMSVSCENRKKFMETIILLLFKLPFINSIFFFLRSFRDISLRKKVPRKGQNYRVKSQFRGFTIPQFMFYLLACCRYSFVEVLLSWKRWFFEMAIWVLSY